MIYKIIMKFIYFYNKNILNVNQLLIKNNICIVLK